MQKMAKDSIRKQGVKELRKQSQRTEIKVKL